MKANVRSDCKRLRVLLVISWSGVAPSLLSLGKKKDLLVSPAYGPLLSSEVVVEQGKFFFLPGIEFRPLILEPVLAGSNL